MSLDASKVSARHLSRDACLYGPQSTVRQVFESTESIDRQHALRQRAVTLGWPQDRVVVIDCDLGQADASSTEREGFRRLVAEGGMGWSQIVLGLEVSRLARNSTDWHRLLEICAVTNTLILDQDGGYDPAHFHDRLLRVLKVTRGEAELRVMTAGLPGTLVDKVGRGSRRRDTDGQARLRPRAARPVEHRAGGFKQVVARGGNRRQCHAPALSGRISTQARVAAALGSFVLTCTKEQDHEP